MLSYNAFRKRSRSGEFVTILTYNPEAFASGLSFMNENKTTEKNKMKFSTQSICQAALIAAVYTALSLLFMPISFGPIQCRISEMLTVLPAFIPAAIPGVTIGCLITNILGGAILPDIIFGTLATLTGAVLTHLLTRGFSARIISSACASESFHAGYYFRLATVLPPILSNTVIVPLVLKFAYQYDDALYFMFLTVCTGEIISIGILGNILISVLKRKEILLQLKKLNALSL